MTNTNVNGKIYFCETPQNEDVSQTDCEGFSYLEVKKIGSLGETGIKENILNYDTWGTEVIQKAKGQKDAGNPVIEVARDPFDPGQTAMRAACLTNNNYVIKVILTDGTVTYNRGLVSGPTRPNGKNEDFDLEMFTFSLNQREIVVIPGATGTAPTLTVQPALSGTETVGETLSCTTGTWTGTATIEYAYQWFRGGYAIAGATEATYDLVTADLGKLVSCRVAASNGVGNAQAMSDYTAAIA